MKPAPFTYHRATSVAEAIRLLAQLAPEGGRILAGGQSLVPLMAFRLAEPAHLIDINRVAGFGALRFEDGLLRIPALARHAEFAPHVAPPPLGPFLSKVARHIAHVPIRERGTFCGSLAHADPAAEWPAVFVALEGTALIRGPDGAREIAAPDWFRGIMTTALEPDEILVEARLPILSPEVRLGFNETSRRAGDYALAMAVVALRIEAGAIRSPRLALGGAETAPRRIAEGESVLEGAAPNEKTFRAAAEAAADSIMPMEDVQVPAGLRRHLVRAVVRRALADACE